MKRTVALCMTIWAAVAVPADAGPPAAPEEAAQTRSFYLQMIHQARADGRPRAALAYLDDFDRLYQGDLDARLLRVDLLLDLGQVDLAETALARIPASTPDAAASAARGNIQAARGDWIKAIPFYRAASLASPTDPLLRNAYGYALLRAGSVDAAIEQLRGAADLASGDTVIRNNLLLALSLAGRNADVATAIGRLPDTTAQAELRRQIAAESQRLATIRSASTGKGS